LAILLSPHSGERRRSEAYRSRRGIHALADHGINRQAGYSSVTFSKSSIHPRIKSKGMLFGIML
jgi:hypothetical protein